jgi:hypothetical protein
MFNEHRIKFINILAYIVLSIALVLMLVLLFWIVYPYKTADIQEPIKVLNENHQVAPNEKISMELHITKYELYPVETTNTIICGTRIYVVGSVLPKGSSTLPKGSYVRIQDAYTLPGDAMPGETCQFTFHNDYKVNPIRVVTKEWRSESFTVK